MELSVNQQLINEFAGVRVFDVNGVIFCMLAKKTDNKIRPGIFKLAFNKGQIHFESVHRIYFPVIIYHVIYSVFHPTAW